MDFARMSMVGKARSRPDLVKQVLRKLSHEGPLPTLRTVVNKLDSPQALGYATAGVVEAVGDGVQGFAPGDRVACAGAGYAAHAELIVVPENLVVAVPDGLSLDRAAFSTLGAIALQGVRIGDPTMGDRAVVIGLGLIGQLTVQLLNANGCRVLGIDLDPKRIQEAKTAGAEWAMAPPDDSRAWIDSATEGHGADLAFVTAASNNSSPIQLAAELCRMRGRVIAVGATAMVLDRRTFYEKELELRMSMSYGPGRYDRRYEEQGYDYPLPFVRWTENRNLDTFLQLAARGAIDPLKLDIETVPFEEALEVYEALAAGERRSLAAVFEYSQEVDRSRTHFSSGNSGQGVTKFGDLSIAFLGAGNYAKAVLLPALKSISGLQNHTVVTSTGPSAQRTGERFGFAQCGTDWAAPLGDESVDVVFVTTQHDQHAKMAEAALAAGKSVWLEKPVGLTPDEVRRVAEAANSSNGQLLVGFNRRFSPHAKAAAKVFASRRAPMTIAYQIAAGATPSGTWITDPQVGGGRILGEVCHFVDLCRFLVGQPVVRVFAMPSGMDTEMDDSVMISLQYADGSTANIQYLARASSDLPKERWEAHCEGKSVRCENFRTTELPKGKKLRGTNQDKGQATALREFLARVRADGDALLPIDEIVETSLVTFAINESIRIGSVVDLGTFARA